MSYSIPELSVNIIWKKHFNNKTTSW